MTIDREKELDPKINAYLNTYIDKVVHAADA